MSGATVQVGNVEIPGRVFLAPLAGFTDLPFRQICRKLGAAYACLLYTSPSPRDCS